MSAHTNVEAPKPHRIPSPAITIAMSSSGTTSSTMVPSTSSSSSASAAPLPLPLPLPPQATNTKSSNCALSALSSILSSKLGSVTKRSVTHREEHKDNSANSMMEEREDDKACREVASIMCPRPRPSANSMSTMAAASPPSHSSPAWSPAGSAAIIAGLVGASPSSKPSPLRASDLPPRLGAPSPSTWRVRDHKVGLHERWPSGDASAYLAEMGEEDTGVDGDEPYYEGDEWDDDDGWADPNVRSASSRGLPISHRAAHYATLGGPLAYHRSTVTNAIPVPRRRQDAAAAPKTPKQLWPRLSTTC